MAQKPTEGEFAKALQEAQPVIEQLRTELQYGLNASLTFASLSQHDKDVLKAFVLLCRQHRTLSF